jgi:hypothetical protein
MLQLSMKISLSAFGPFSPGPARWRSQTTPHPHSKWRETPAQNVRKSQQYDYLVATNGNFRAYRMRKECGPIRDPELRSNCVASFGAYEPAR